MEHPSKSRSFSKSFSNFAVRWGSSGGSGGRALAWTLMASSSLSGSSGGPFCAETGFGRKRLIAAMWCFAPCEDC